jgi:hypothetical protein
LVHSPGTVITAAPVPITLAGCGELPSTLTGTLAFTGLLATLFTNGPYTLNQISPNFWITQIPANYPNAPGGVAYFMFGALQNPIQFSTFPPVMYGFTIADLNACRAFDVTGMDTTTCSPLSIEFNWINSHYVGPRGASGKVTITE